MSLVAQAAKDLMSDDTREASSLLRLLGQKLRAATDSGLSARWVNALLRGTTDLSRPVSASTQGWLRRRVTGTRRVPRVLLLACARDRELADDVYEHLGLLEQQEVISLQRTDVLPAGVDVVVEKVSRLQRADMLLVLLSNDLLRDPECQVLVDRALLRLRAPSSPLRVIPVPLRPCAWKETALGVLQPLPLDGRPVTTMASLEEGLLAIAEGLRAVTRGQ